jgi:FkbM family methyltransferase
MISGIYIRLMRMGFFKSKYAELHFTSKLVKKGDVVLDIGANLAYYSYFLKRHIGESGKLLAVEPIPLFAEVWSRNMKGAKGVELFNCALGGEAKQKVKMSIPIVNGVVRHGLTKVVEEGTEENEAILSFEVPMKVGDELVSEQNLEKLNFIKCDVEGFEQYVIPSLDKTIDTHFPLLQIELSGKENRQRVVDFLLKKAYQLFILKNEFLTPIQKNDIFTVDQDFYFIHETKLEEKSALIRK